MAGSRKINNLFHIKQFIINFAIQCIQRYSWKIRGKNINAFRDHRCLVYNLKKNDTRDVERF